ncbi:MAG: DUF123 domain-containing protein [Candidatus Promineifilaceae bacterium]|nr:DUF123 domain-containing protein [Candidatus Promineifilaceae bacterium]
MLDRITVMGPAVNSGAYLLRIEVSKDLMVRFGQFRRGQQITVSKGAYVYIGSAMAAGGSMTLARRLLRHATRTKGARPHFIREQLLIELQTAGLGAENLQPPLQKKLYWNIDYLLEQNAANLTHIIIIRSAVNLEDRIAHYLAIQKETRVLVKGLGAQDKRDQTHLMNIDNASSWWRRLPAALAEL